jgi:hypothetical protein
MKNKLILLAISVCMLAAVTLNSCQTEKSSYSAKTKIDGKYKQYTNRGRLVSAEVIKEYKNGEFTETLSDDSQNITQYKGKYTVVNDSIYVETIDYDLFKTYQDEIIMFKYEFKGDTMIQSGIVRYKERPIEEHLKRMNPSSFFVQPSSIKVYWLKVKE